MMSVRILQQIIILIRYRVQQCYWRYLLQLTYNCPYLLPKREINAFNNANNLL